MSLDASENFADWLAYKTLSQSLQRKNSLGNKRDASALSTALFCEEPGIKSNAPDLAEVQKKFDMEVHPENRVRRISLYNKTNSELVNCNSDSTRQGFSSCEP